MGRCPAKLAVACALGLLLALGSACATSTARDAPRYRFFAASNPEADPWFRKVESWQHRARRERTAIGPVPAGVSLRNSGLLQVEMGSFRDAERRDLARRITARAQVEARRYYRWEANEDPADDHWPTFKELLDHNGDDCDGLDLIIYELLREFGFGEGEIYRVIVRRNQDGANHMATLWFEERDDPWLLDATGAISPEMIKFSELRGWTPTKVFDENEQFLVVEEPERPHARGD